MAGWRVWVGLWAGVGLTLLDDAGRRGVAAKRRARRPTPSSSTISSGRCWSAIASLVMAETSPRGSSGWTT